MLLLVIPIMDKEGLPWVELYRPRTIDNIVQQHEIVSALKLTLTSANSTGFLPIRDITYPLPYCT